MSRPSPVGVNARAGFAAPVVVRSTGFAYPSDVVDNDAFFARCRFPITDDRDALVRETRMQTRRWCGPDEDTFTMARDAVAMALAGRDPSTVDVLVVSSCSTIPGTNVPYWERSVVGRATGPNPVVADLSPLLLGELGIDHAMGMDLKATYCAGFVRGLQLLDGLLQNPNYRSGLLVCTDVGGRFATAESNRSAFCFVVGDAAGAVLLERGAPGDAGIVDYTGTMIPSGAHLTSFGPDGESLLVRGRAAGEATHALLVRDARVLLARNGLSVGDVDWLLPMQTHAGAVDAVCAELGVPRERCLWSGGETGYAASASIPAAFARRRADGTIRPGDRVLVIAVGAGMNSGAALLHG